MATTTVEESQMKKVGSKSQKEVSDVLGRSSNPLEELRVQAEMAYSSYLGAQRKVARAYREREQAEVANYKDVEEQAYIDCDETIKKALAARADAERSAREAYEKSLERSGKVYEEAVETALRVCRQTIQQQWQVTNELSDQIWNIFQGNAAA